MTTSEKEIRVSVQVAIVAAVAMAGLIAFFSCANADGPENARNTNGAEPKHEHTAAGGHEEPKADDSNALRIPKEPTARSVVVNWLLGGLVATQIWQLLQAFKLNREVGEVSVALGRISSDTESEKITRAKVNAIILKRLGVDGSDIAEALKEPEK